MTVWLLVQTEIGAAGQVAKAAAETTGASIVDDIAGPYDVIIRLDATETTDLPTRVEAVRNIDGVARTLTCHVGRTHNG